MRLLDVAPPSETVRNRSQPLAAVRNRSQPFATIRNRSQSSVAGSAAKIGNLFGYLHNLVSCMWHARHFEELHRHYARQVPRIRRVVSLTCSYVNRTVRVA